MRQSKAKRLRREFESIFEIFDKHAYNAQQKHNWRIYKRNFK